MIYLNFIKQNTLLRECDVYLKTNREEDRF